MVSHAPKAPNAPGAPDAPILNRARSHYTVPRKDFPGRHDWLMEPIRALYAAELVEADAVLGRILDAVSEAGLDEQLLVVVSADHGEELLDHDGIGHASTTLDSAPHPELVHIPLYLRLPDGRGAGRQVQGRFEQTDLMTTLLPLLGVEVPELAPGVPAWGRDWSAAVLSQAAAPADRPLLVTGSPCGWQCPVADRDKRIHALVDGTSWTFCREGAGVCDPELQGQLQSARRLRARLETPVASPR